MKMFAWEAGADSRQNTFTLSMYSCNMKSKTHRARSVPHSLTHQLWGSGVSCWWSAREKPKKVPWSPNLCSVWVVSRLKPHTWLKRVNRAQRKVVQRWVEEDEREIVCPCPSRAAIARCRASSVQEGYRADSFYGSQRAERDKMRQIQRSLLSCVDASCSQILFLLCSIVLALNSGCCCQSEEQAVKMWPLLVCVCEWVCFSQCMCASPSS